MNEKVWWYLARSSGIVAMMLLVASVVWGVLLATRALKPHDRPAWLLDLHRWLGGMALVMTALHLLGLVLDGYVSQQLWADTELLLLGAQLRIELETGSLFQDTFGGSEFSFGGPPDVLGAEQPSLAFDTYVGINGAQPGMQNNMARVEPDTGELVLENMTVQGFSVTRRVLIEKDGSFVR